jgi:NTP pyrophosphatase (non-canonical NTP hydrolase)
VDCIDNAAKATGMYDFDNYQKEAARTMVQKPMNDLLTNFGLGISGEAGEVADLIKKAVFHGHGIRPNTLAKEIGDVLWYCAALCTTMGLELSDVAERNIEKLKERYPDGFSEEASRNRND